MKTKSMNDQMINAQENVYDATTALYKTSAQIQRLNLVIKALENQLDGEMGLESEEEVALRDLKMAVQLHGTRTNLVLEDTSLKMVVLRAILAEKQEDLRGMQEDLRIASAQLTDLTTTLM